MTTNNVKLVPMATIRKSGKDRHNPLHVAACRNKMNEARKTIALVIVSTPRYVKPVQVFA